MLIFYLDQDLKLFQVNQNLKISLLDSIQAKTQEKSTKTYLNLENLLQNFWQKNYKKLKKAKKIHFLICPNASFNNTRAVYIWLINWQNINLINQNKVDFYLQKIFNNLDLTKLNKIIIQDLLKNQSQDLEYSKEPRIN